MTTLGALARLFWFRKWNFLFLMASRTVIFGLSFQAVGLVSRLLLDELSGDRPLVYGPWLLCAALVGMALARIGLVFADVPVHFRTQFALTSLLRKNIMERILEKPAGQALPHSAGEAISRLRGDVEAFSQILMQFNFQVGNIAFAVIGVAVMLRINPLMTTIVFPPLLIVLIVIRVLRSRIQQYHQRFREDTGSITSLISELFAAVQSVKAHSAEPRSVRRFEQLSAIRMRSAVRNQMLQKTLGSGFDNIAQIGTGIILLLAASSIASRTFTVGDFALFVYNFTYISRAVVSGLGTFLTQLRQVDVSLRRLLELIAETDTTKLVEPSNVHLRGPLPEILSGVGRSSEHRFASLEARGLTYSHAGTKSGIVGVDFRVRREEFVVIAVESEPVRALSCASCWGFSRHREAPFSGTNHLSRILRNFSYPLGSAIRLRSPRCSAGA